MLPFRKVLFPIDYSAPCEAIIPYVQDIVQHFNAQLTLIRAYGLGTMGELIGADPQWMVELRTSEEQHLKDFSIKHFPGLQVELRLAEGEPGTVIHQEVVHEGTDLVMMPTRGSGPLRKFLLGSVASKVLHDVSAAVWTGTNHIFVDNKEAKADQKPSHHPSAPYKSILCALDESEEAEAVLRAGASLAKSYGAKLNLLTAVPVPPTALEMDFTVYQKALTEAAEYRMRDLKAKVGVDALHTITPWMLLDALHDEAERVQADLLIVGRGELQERFGRLWSRLYPVIRESPCPVLSI
ncbi:MAG: universal stress protein [Acidobacteriota bacterium]